MATGRFPKIFDGDEWEVLKACGLLVLFLAGSLVARAADDTVTMQEMVQGAQQWAQENLDTNVLNALPEVDESAVREFFREIQQRFQGDYVDVAALRQTAQTILPLLESREDTGPTPRGSRRRWITWRSRTKSGSRSRRQQLKPTSRPGRFPIPRRKRNASFG